MDAIAVKEFAELAGLEDEAILALAKLDNRVLVSENVADFALLSRTIDHVGVVFCHPRRFPRDAGHLAGLVSALVQTRPAPAIRTWQRSSRLVAGAGDLVM